MDLRPERDEWAFFFFFFFYIYCTTRKQILNLCKFLFLETQETGALPKRQKAAWQNVEGRLESMGRAQQGRALELCVWPPAGVPFTQGGPGGLAQARETHRPTS